MLTIEFIDPDVITEAYENLPDETAQLLAAVDILEEVVKVKVYDDTSNYAGIVRVRNQGDDTGGADRNQHWCSAKIIISEGGQKSLHKCDFTIMIPVKSFNSDPDAMKSLKEFEKAKKDVDKNHIGRKTKIAIKNYIFDNQVVMVALWLCRKDNMAQKNFLEDYLSSRGLKEYIVTGKLNPLTDEELADKRKELIKAWKASDKYNGTELNFGV